MAKGTKRLVMLVAALVLTVAMATTTTFAWFTLNDEVSISNMDFTVSTTDGLEVSLDNAAWGVNITANYNNLILDAVTPVLDATDTDAWASGYIFEGVTGTDIGAYSVGNGTTAYPWMNQPIYFRTVGKDFNVKLSGITVDCTEGGRKVEVPVALTEDQYGNHTAYSSGTAIDTSALYAVRIAIFVSTAKGTDDNWNTADDTYNIFIYKVVAGETDTHFSNAASVTPSLNLAAVIYNASGVGTALTSTDLAQIAATDAASVATTPVDIGATLLAAGTDSDSDGLVDSADICKMYGSIVVWLEGKDGNCTNACIGDILSIDFDFELGTEVA